MRLDKRNKMLIGGFVLGLLLCHQLAVKKTLELRAQYLKGTEQHERAVEIKGKLAELRKKEQQLDARFKAMDLGSANVQNELLRFLNEQGEKHSVKIIDFKAPHVAVEGSTTIKTYRFVLEGYFTDILRVAYGLETKRNFGGIAHMAFEKQLDPRKRKTHLQATLHLQQME